jgi:PncC family amidohydrolase
MPSPAADATTLAEEIGALLTSHSWTLAVAESCTGGLIGHCITQVAGSSAYFRGGVLAYSNDVKMALLDVSEQDLAQFGAVSEPVARQMADGVCARIGADVGVGITGIMGPGGESSEKPVGLVYVSVRTPDGCRVASFRNSGTRSRIKELSCLAALTMLRNVLRQQGDQNGWQTG